MDRPQVGRDIIPCGACREYVSVKDGCSHVRFKRRTPLPNSTDPEYETLPVRDKRRARNRLYKQLQRDRAKASLTSDE